MEVSHHPYVHLDGSRVDVGPPVWNWHDVLDSECLLSGPIDWMTRIEWHYSFPLDLANSVHWFPCGWANSEFINCYTLLPPSFQLNVFMRFDVRFNEK